jgi:endonuclease/exonuclease/phosphatase family metal-dependent hydrolase
VSSHRSISLTILTFNIRYGSAPDGPLRWTVRKRLVLDRIRDARPDLIGLQECEDKSQVRYLRRALGDYGFEGVRSDPDEPEMAPVFYRRSAFRKMGSGHFWLSAIPSHSGSRSWGAAFARTVTWVKLERRGTSMPFYFVNTHFDYAPGVATRSATVLRRWLDKAVAHRPVVISGDFNATKRSPAYRRLTLRPETVSGREGVRLIDAYRAVHSDGAGEGTYHAYGSLRRPAALDWILASSHFAVVDAYVDQTYRAGRFPSDHFPLVATMRFA